MENKKWKKWHKIVLSILVILIAFIGFICWIATRNTNNGTQPPEKEKIIVTSSNWDSLSYDQKQSWIKKRISVIDDNSLDFEIKLRQLIKSKFKYPEEAHFGLREAPELRNGEITDADAGYVFFHGGGTCKNSFGVKSRFTYSVRTIIKPDTTIVDDVSVNIPQ